MNDNPLVTVVIPTWNREQLVQQAVASVAAQTYKNWELFVVDDGSTDGTTGRLCRLGLPNLHIVQSAHVAHIGRLRNLGANAGRGELIAFLDSDDLWRPEKLEKQIRAIQKAGTGWSYTEYSLVIDRDFELPLHCGRAPAISGNIVRALLQEETGVCPCTLLVRRSLFEAIEGFSENPRMAYRDDAEIALRLACASEVVALPERLTLVREHAGRLTKALPAPHEHSAAVYELFLHYNTSPDLKKLARERWIECLSRAAIQRMHSGEYGLAASLYWRMLAEGVLGGGLLRAVARRALTYLQPRG
jgi:glycosyltransferase involved in cell wall biosynthesis